MTPGRGEKSEMQFLIEFCIFLADLSTFEFGGFSGLLCKLLTSSDLWA